MPRSTYVLAATVPVAPGGSDVHISWSLLRLSFLFIVQALIAAVDDPSLYVAAAAGQLLGILAFKVSLNIASSL